MKFVLSLVMLAAGSVFAAPKIDNPGGFAEYYCGDLFPAHFIAAPASRSGNEQAVQTCAGRYAMAEAVMSYGPKVKFAGLVKVMEGEEGINAYIFNVKTEDGKSHAFYTQLQADISKRAPDGNDAIILMLTPLGVCEGKTADACG